MTAHTVLFTFGADGQKATSTFRSFNQGVVVTLSLRQDGANFFVRCQPSGYAVTPKFDTACASRAEAESLYTQKFNIGMTGVA